MSTTTLESVQTRLANKATEIERLDVELTAFAQVIAAIDHLKQVGLQQPISDAAIVAARLTQERAVLVNAAARVRRMRGSVQASLTRGQAYMLRRGASREA